MGSDFLSHYGMPRRSGRYPWGSGDTPYQKGGVDLVGRIEELKKANPAAKEKDIANMMGMTINEMRDREAICKIYRRNDKIATAKRLIEKEGLSQNAAAKKMGINESTLRSLLDADRNMRKNEVINKAEELKAAVEKKGIIDVGAGVERQLGISDTKMQEAITLLYDRDEYEVYQTSIPQVTNPGQRTIMNLLCPKGTTYGEAYEACKEGKVHNIEDFDSNGELVKPGKVLYPPESISGDRIKIVYNEEGGLDRDGLILLRRNVEDLSLGESAYSQVRIAVDNESYLKGMAAYGDDKLFGEGQDVIFYTNKHLGTPPNKVFKAFKPENPDNPFGTEIKEDGQSFYTDKNGNQKLSAINKVNDQGDWEDWSRTLSSQFLAKQDISLMKNQLNLTYANSLDEFNEIKNLTNTTVRKHYLEEFANECDAASIHLKAASLPRQRTHVLLPNPELGENEVYAPNYRNGEKLALIRYPHAGTFEIPIVTVNNKSKSSAELIGPDSSDAMVVNKKTADRLSGADFDGDTVTAIPLSNRVRITSTPALKGLDGFDPKEEYPPTETSKRMKKASEQREMGTVSNLIMDMTLKGASDEEKAKAVRHSMVVIDSVKHGLDYKRSEQENDIEYLKEKYQRHENLEGESVRGASTLITRAKHKVNVDERQGAPYIDKDTGELIYKTSGRTYPDKSGKIVKATESVPEMSIVKDANELSSGYPQEKVYAKYANDMKALANEARLEYVNTKDTQYSSSAAKEYAPEVKELKTKLNSALLNAPRERQAQVIAGNRARLKKEAAPDMTDGEYRKIKNQELAKARAEVGSSSKARKIDITDREWEAIQKGAVSGTTLRSILNNSDADKLRERSMPKKTAGLTSTQQNRIAAYRKSGYTNQEIADKLGVSVSTVSKYSKGGGKK